MYTFRNFRPEIKNHVFFLKFSVWLLGLGIFFCKLKFYPLKLRGFKCSLKNSHGIPSPANHLIVSDRRLT